MLLILRNLQILHTCKSLNHHDKKKNVIKTNHFGYKIAFTFTKQKVFTLSLIKNRNINCTPPHTASKSGRFFDISIVHLTILNLYVGDFKLLPSIDKATIFLQETIEIR